MLQLRNSPQLIKHFIRKTLPVTINTQLQHLSVLTVAPSNCVKVRLSPPQPRSPLLPVPFRNKSKKSKSQREAVTESETDEAEEDDAWEKTITDKSSKLMNVNVSSLRIDALLRPSLGIARNKVETLFYENKIRLNGHTVKKKSELVEEGDEVDVIKQVHPDNPNLLTVARVEVLAVKPREEGYKVKMRRCKQLLVENYLKE